MDYNISQLPNSKESLIFLQEEKTSEQSVRVNVFDYFSNDSLYILKEACDLAKLYKSSIASPWHLLVTLTTKKPIENKIGNALVSLKAAAIQKVTEGSANDYKGKVILSPEVKKILIASYFVSKQYGSNLVELPHMLLALSVYPECEETFTNSGFVTFAAESFYIPNSLTEYITDLSNISEADAKIYSNRDSELKNILRILTRESKHDVVLVGDEGIGKSVIAEGLSKFIIENKIDNFSGARVLALNLGSLFSLTKFSKTVLSAITDLASSTGNVIFFLENPNLLTSSVQMSQFVDFIQTLKKKSNTTFIFPATPAYYKEYVQGNPYLSENFEVVQVQELSSDDSVKILEKESGKFEKYYKLKIEPSVFKEVVALSKRYLQGKLPQKAISLLEEVCAGAFLSKKSTVNMSDVRDIVAQKTGIPMHTLSVSEAEKLKNLESHLAEYVVGQKEALLRVSEALRRARAGLKDNKKPIGSFLFLGPTGVGKTELAKTLASLFFNDQKAFLRFDMSEYAESFTAQRLIGSPPGYVGYEEGGQLTNQVIAHPYSLILFDEIEKAHPRVFDLFLQILDDGRLTDSKGTVVDFRNTLIIFTSNIASREIFENGSNLIDANFDKKSFFDNTIMRLVRNYFRPELVNRFDDIIMFNPLSKSELVQIARLKVNQLKERLLDKQINFEISDEKLGELVDASYDPSFGARPLEREIREKIENPLAKKIIAGELKEGDNISW